MTKRSLTIIAGFLLFMSTTSAQSTMGIQAGTDFPRILNIVNGYNASGGAVSKNSQSITRVYGGFLVDIPLDKRKDIVLRPSLLYFEAGGETPDITDFNGNLITPQTKYRFNYIQLPLQLLFSPKTSIGRPWIGGGFYSGVLVHATATTTAGTSYFQIGNNQGADIKRFDLGFVTSAGLTLRCGFLIGVDFRQSLSSLVPDPPAGTPAVRNSVWGVHIGYISKI